MILKRTKTALLLLALMAVVPVAAQDRIVLSLDEAQQYAIEHNYTLQNASLDIRKAQASRWQAIAGLLPQITASTSYSNMMGYKMDLGQMQLSMPPYATFGVQTAIGVNGAQIVSIGIANISRRMADITLEKNERMIADQVETLYFSALVTEETIALLEKNRESMQKLYEITQSSVDAGVAEQTDADKLEVQVATMDNALNTTRRALEMVYNSLRLQLCLDENVEIKLTQTIDDLLNFDTTSQLLTAQFDLDDNYDYQLLKHNTELARKQIALTGWQNGPTFSIYHQYSGRHNFSNEPTMNMTPPNMIGAQLNIPLFTSGKMTAAMKDARLSYQKQLNTLENTELSLNLQHRQLVYNLRTALEKYNLQKQSVDVAERVFDNISLKYKYGVASSLDVTNAGTSLLTAQSNYVESLLDIVEAKVSLQQLLNKK